MSATIDERIVKMQFDNSGFESGATTAINLLEKLKLSLNFKGASSGLEEVKGSVNSLNLDQVSQSVDECSSHFKYFDDFVTGIFSKLGGMVASFATNMVSKITTQPMIDGLKEYELQIGSVQTILSNTREELSSKGFTTETEQVGLINEYLDELNTYADKTIYNFSQMTRNIGTFTAAGVELGTATRAIQGVANLAAVSGSNANQASTAMYQLSQALSSGTVKAQDWNSVVNAGMGGQLFQNAIKRTARVHGIAVDDMIADYGDFKSTLQEGWFTADILEETLNQLSISYGEVGDEAYNAAYAELTAAGYTEKEAKEILDLAKDAEKAATKIRTWSQLWDTVGESLGSGWASTWRLLVGDFEEATKLFTWFGDSITNMIGKVSDARNAVISDFVNANEGKGREALVDLVKNLYTAVMRPIRSIARAFSDVFGVSGEQLYNLVTKLSAFSSKLVITKGTAKALRLLLTDIFRIAHSFIGIAVNVLKIFGNIAGVVFAIVKPIIKELFGFFSLVASGAAVVSEGLLLVSGFIESASWYLIYGVADGVRKLIDWFSNLEIVKRVKKWFDDFFKSAKNVSDILREAFGFLTESKGVLEVAGRSFELPSRLESFFNSFFRDAGDGFQNFVDGFVKADDKLSYVGKSIADKMNSIKDAVKAVFDVFSSPLSFNDWLEGFREDTMQDLIYGVFGENQELANQIYDLYLDLDELVFPRWLLDIIQNSETWSSAFDKIKEHLKQLALDGFAKLPKPVQDVAKVLYDFGSTVFTDVKNWVTSTDAFKQISSKLEEFTNGLPVHVAVWNWVKEKADYIWTTLTNFFNGWSMDGVTQTLSNFADTVSRKFAIIKNLFSMLSGVSAVTGQSKYGLIFKAIGDNLMASLNSISPTAAKLFSRAVDVMATGFGHLKDEAGKLSFENIKTNLSLFVQFIINLPSTIGGIFIDLKNRIVDFFKNIPWPSFEKLKEMGALLGKIGFGIKISQFIKSLTGLNKMLSGVGKGILEWPSSFGDALSRFGEGFNKWKQETKADAFVKIAKGIAILAVSLFIVASLPTNDLIKAAVALGILGAAIATFMIIFGLLDKFKIIKGKAIQSFGSAVMGLGVGVLALAAAALVLSQIPVDQLVPGIIACFALIVACSIFAKSLKSNGKSLLLGSIGMVIFAHALNAMVDVINKMKGIDITDMSSGLWAFVIVIGALTVFGKFAAKQIGKLLASFLKFGAGLLLIAVSIGVFAISALLLYSVIKHIDDVIPVIVAIVGFVAIFTAVCLLLKDAHPDEVGKAVIKFALGLVIMAAALLLLSVVSLEKVLASMFALAALLGIFGLIVYNVDEKRLEAGSKAINKFGIALAIMAAVLAGLSFIPWTALIPGAIALGVLVAEFGIMAAKVDPSRMEAASTAMLKFSASLLIIGGALGVLSFISWQSILIGTVAIAALIGAFWALTKFSNAGDLEASGSAMILFSLSLIAIAGAFNLLGMVKFEDIIGHLIAIGAAMMLFAVITGILSGMSLGVLTVSAAFTLFAFGVTLLADAITTLANGIDWGAVGAIPGQLFNTIYGGICNLLGIESPSTVMEGIGENTIQGFVNGITGSLGLVDESGQFSVDALMSKFDGLPDMLFGSGEEGQEGLLSGLDGLPEQLSAKASEALNSFIDGIDVQQLVDKGTEMASGILEGLSGQVFDEIKAWPGKLFTSIWDGIKSQFVINSPSEKMKTLGGYIGEGLHVGLGDWASQLGTKATELGNIIINGISSAKDYVGEKVGALVGGAQATLSESTGLFQSSGAALGNAAVAGAEVMGTGLQSVTASAKGLMNKTLGDSSGSVKAINSMTSSINVASKVMQIKLKTRGAEAVAGLATGMRSRIGSVTSAVSSVVQAASKSISLYKRYYDIGRNASRGLADGLNSLYPAVRAAAQRIVDEADRAARAKAKVKSPSRVFMEIGAYIGEGLAIGISNSASNVRESSETLAGSIPEAFTDILSSMSVDIEDILDTDYNPVITPVINPTEFNYGLDQLSNAINNRNIGNFNVGSLNYNGELAARLSDNMDLSQQAMDMLAKNGIDYDRLGVSVVNALIRAGVHVELDGGEFMGYLAGEIQDVRRQFA